MNAIEEHIELAIALRTTLPPLIAQAAIALRNASRIMICGNGGSAADAQHFAAELVGRFEKERDPISCIALTTDASVLTAVGNDYGFRHVFARQVLAHGRAGDVLIAITTSGNSANVLKAIEAAHSQGVRVIALTGRDGGPARMLKPYLHINIPHDRTARVQEMHSLVLHCLAEAIDA